MPNALAVNLDALRRRFGAIPVLPTYAGSPGGIVETPADPFDRGISDALPNPAPPVVCGIGWASSRALDLLYTQSPDCRVVLLEPDALALRRLLERRSWADQITSGRLAVLAGPEYSGGAAIAGSIPGLAQAPVIVHPLLDRERPDDVRRAREALGKLAFQGDANDTARRALASRYVLHTLMNLPAIAREGDAGALAGAFAGVPAIIFAAGPSLDRNVHEVYPYLDRALLIACDTAVWPLTSHGVAPHLVVAVDASESNARHLSSLPPNRTFFAAEASMHPSALGPFAGRTFFFKVANHEPWPWLASLGLDRVRLDAWGSVATTAFAAALEMGCDPIVFAGADFAFTGGRPYCRGTSNEAQWSTWAAGGKSYEDIWRLAIGRWPKHSAPDLRGADTRTAAHLVAFRDWIVERAASRRDRRVVNTTDAGILFGPAIEQTPPAAIFESKPKFVSGDLRRRLAALHTPAKHGLASALPAATSVLAGHDGALIDRWRAFANDSLSRDAIRAALASPEQRAWALGFTARDHVRTA